MNILTLQNQIKKTAIQFQVGGFRPLDNLTASWIGNIAVGQADENWPEWNGKPMIPICQLNLTELAFKPDNLQDIALIGIFMNGEEIPDDTPNGEGWLLRAYKSLDQLIELEKPNVKFPIKPFQLKPTTVDDYPCNEDCPVDIPEKYGENYNEMFPNQGGIKLGGWPTLIQSEIYWAPFNEHPTEPSFALQIDSVEKAHWQWGHRGVAYIGRGTKPGFTDVWTFAWQSF